MLVLSRKKGEVIRISDEISIEVVQISGNRARLGVIAPAHVRILRGELLTREMEIPENGNGQQS